MEPTGSGPLTAPGRRRAPPHPARSPLLVIVPHEADGPGSPLRWTVVGGLPLVRRIALAARRAGFEQVVLAGARPEDELLLAGTGATALTRAPGVPCVRGRVVLLADCVVPQPAWLEHLAQLPLAPRHLGLDGTLAAIVDASEDSHIPVVATRGGMAAAVFAAVQSGLEVVETSIDPVGRFVMSGPADAPAAETWLLRSLIKPHETFLSRSFERRLSLALTRRLARTSLTPNAMSLIMIAVGLLGAPCFLSASPTWQVAGALLFLTHSILDGCDGELARLKFLESRLRRADRLLGRQHRALRRVPVPGRGLEHAHRRSLATGARRAGRREHDGGGGAPPTQCVWPADRDAGAGVLPPGRRRAV